MKTAFTSILCAMLLCQLVVNAEESATRIRSGHNLLEDAAQNLSLRPGEQVDALAFKTIDGNAIYLEEAIQNGPAVFVFMSTTCPLAKRYTMRLRRLHEAYADQGVQMFAVFPNSDETTESIETFQGQVKYPFAVVRDVNGYLVERLGASMTPQALVIDRQGRLCYRGAIDDHRYENRVEKKFLASALDSLLAGTEIKTPTAKAMGCSIHLTSKAAEDGITYTSHIARILQDNCQSCHREGQVAPFSLSNYEDAVTWQTEIQAYTHSRLMPPWKASPEVGEFSNDVSLSEKEIDLIAKWVECGAPLGDPADMPPQPKFNDEWAMGEPDLIVEMPEEYTIGPEGEDDYRHFIVPYEAAEHRFIEAVDVQPGNRSVVHHVIGYVDTSGKARELDAADEGPGYTRFGDVGFEPASIVGGWAPGSRPSKTPEGTGRWLPKKCDIVLQVHYYRTGVEERDRTKIGIYFSKAERPVPTRLAVAIDQDFRLKPGKSEIEVRNDPDQCVIKEASYLFSIAPHMHLLGETMDVTAVLPDGNRIPLVKIDDWDFNWQITYRYRDLIYLPAGTRIEMVANFDNSKDNPNNPYAEPKEVRWGEKTTDEMCIAFLGVVRASEYDPEKKARRQPAGADVAVNHRASQ